MINFPNSPTLNQIFTVSGKSWRWNGSAWQTVGGGSGGVTSYNDLTDLPTLGSAAATASTDYATASHAHGNITNAGAIGTTASLPVITGEAGVLQAGSFGTTAGTFCEGNDSRLSDSRTPTSHKSSHATGGADALAPADIGAAASSHTHPLSHLEQSSATNGQVATWDATTAAWVPQTPLTGGAATSVANTFTAGQTINAPANTSALNASYSVTGANTTALLNLTGTWNTTGAARGILLNVTDTASATESNLIDLQTGGTSRLRVSKSGILTITGLASAGSLISGESQFRLGAINIGFQSGGGSGGAAFGVTSNFYGGCSTIGFSVSTLLGYHFTSGSLSTSPDVSLFRDGAGILAQRVGANAQTYRLYGTFTDASNNRRLEITSTTAGVFTLTATGIGTGASGNLLKLTRPVLIPAPSVTLATNGDLAFEATSNTTLTIRYRGTDGTTRSATLTLT